MFWKLETGFIIDATNSSTVGESFVKKSTTILVIDSILFLASVTQSLPAHIDMHLTSEDCATGLIGLWWRFPGINGNGCSQKT